MSGERERHKKRKRERRSQTCVHFTGLPLGGIRNASTCKAGVDYRKHVGGPDLGWARKAPCTPPYMEGDELVPCDKFQAPTNSELAAEEARSDAIVEKLLRGVSQCCEAPIDESQVIASGQHKGHGPRFCSKCSKLDHMV